MSECVVFFKLRLTGQTGQQPATNSSRLYFFKVPPKFADLLLPKTDDAVAFFKEQMEAVRREFVDAFPDKLDRLTFVFKYIGMSQNLIKSL